MVGFYLDCSLCFFSNQLVRENIMNKVLILLAAFSFNAVAEPVNINAADAQTISESLKGIGMKKAEEIVKYRTENGEFKSADELVNVSGIGTKTVENNKSDILLGDPAKK